MDVRFDKAIVCFGILFGIQFDTSLRRVATVVSANRRRLSSSRLWL